MAGKSERRRFHIPEEGNENAKKTTVTKEASTTVSTEASTTVSIVVSDFDEDTATAHCYSDDEEEKDDEIDKVAVAVGTPNDIRARNSGNVNTCNHGNVNVDGYANANASNHGNVNMNLSGRANNGGVDKSKALGNKNWGMEPDYSDMDENSQQDVIKTDGTRGNFIDSFLFLRSLLFYSCNVLVFCFVNAHSQFKILAKTLSAG